MWWNTTKKVKKFYLNMLMKLLNYGVNHTLMTLIRPTKPKICSGLFKFKEICWVYLFTSMETSHRIWNAIFVGIKSISSLLNLKRSRLSAWLKTLRIAFSFFNAIRGRNLVKMKQGKTFLLKTTWLLSMVPMFASSNFKKCWRKWRNGNCKKWMDQVVQKDTPFQEC